MHSSCHTTSCVCVCVFSHHRRSQRDSQSPEHRLCGLHGLVQVRTSGPRLEEGVLWRQPQWTVPGESVFFSTFYPDVNTHMETNLNHQRPIIREQNVVAHTLQQGFQTHWPVDHFPSVNHNLTSCCCHFCQVFSTNYFIDKQTPLTIKPKKKKNCTENRIQYGKLN